MPEQQAIKNYGQQAAEHYIDSRYGALRWVAIGIGIGGVMASAVLSPAVGLGLCGVSIATIWTKGKREEYSTIHRCTKSPSVDVIYRHLPPEKRTEFLKFLQQEYPDYKPSPIAPKSEKKIPIKSIFSDPYEWFESVKKYPLVMVLGQMGSGKSTFVKYLIECRLEMEHEVKILDPHCAYGDWDGLDVVGKGNNFSEIQEYLEEFNADCDRRYHERAHNPNPQFSRRTIVCEEMLKWADKLDTSVIDSFDQNCSADLRKIKESVIKISHNDTNSSVGGKSGLKGVQKHYIKIHLLGKPDPDSDDGVSPAFRAILTLPNEASKEVKVNPNWRPSRLDSFTVPPRATPVPPSDPHSEGDTLTHDQIRSQIERFVTDNRSEKWILEEFFGLTKNSSTWREYREIIREIKSKNVPEDNAIYTPMI